MFLRARPERDALMVSSAAGIVRGHPLEADIVRCFASRHGVCLRVAPALPRHLHPAQTASPDCFDLRSLLHDAGQGCQ